jgi:protein-disulfide isomerase
MSAERAQSSRAQKRVYQLGALLVTIAAVMAVLIAIISSGSTSQLAPGKPVPGAPQTLALLSGIPQRGASLGDLHAPVTLVEFGDLQCPTCALFAQETLPAIITRYVRSGRVLLVFNAVNFIGADSARAARLAYALGEQGRLWQFIELMYRNQGLENSSYVTDTYLRALAGAIPGADVTRALAARDSSGVQSQLQEASAAAHVFAITGTPSFLLARSGERPRRFSPAGLDASAFNEGLDRLLGGG